MKNMQRNRYSERDRVWEYDHKRTKQKLEQEQQKKKKKSKYFPTEIYVLLFSLNIIL